MILHFPKNLRTDKRGIEFLAFLWGMSKKVRNGKIYWNLKHTRKIETNLLSFLGLVLQRMDNRKNIINLIIKDSNGSDKIINNDVLTIIFENYSSYDNELLKYNLLDEQNSKDSINMLLVENLKEFNLLYYSDIKLLLSEFIANIFMHTTDKKGSMSGYITEKKDILISVCNMGMTIKKNIEHITNYRFIDDIAAISWALKKTNTTRDDKECGGLGLYLLRKYIKKIDAEAYIISGKAFIMLSGKNCFDILNINDIYLQESIEMKSFFPGTMVVLKFNNEKNYTINNNTCLHEIDLL